MISDEQLQKFCAAIDVKIVANLGGMEQATRLHRFAPSTFERGQKFARIVRNDSGRSVFCFVDLETGAILKAGGWKAPEPKRHVRGNIANGADDVGPYGPHSRVGGRLRVF